MDRRTANNHHALESLPPWADVPAPRTSRLMENLECDVCVIGGGIAGLTTAYLLARENKNVCLIEDSGLGAGQSGRTTAQFSTLLDIRYSDLERIHGIDVLKQVYRGQVEAITQVEDIILDENIDCDLLEVNGYLFSSTGEVKSGPEPILVKEHETLRRMGISEVSVVSGAPVPFATGPALKVSGQLQLHPRKYLVGLASAILDRGQRIHTQTHAAEIRGGSTPTIRTSDGHWIRCNSLVVATHTPINDRVAIHTKQRPYRTYVIGFQAPRRSLPYGLYWDLDSPYHFIRLIPGYRDDHDLLLVGGEDHKTGRKENPGVAYELLTRWTRERFPMAGTVTHKWSGQIMASIDGLPYLGVNPMDSKNVYAISGDSGCGMTSGTLGARIVTDGIFGRSNPWQSIYDPSRLRTRILPEYVREGLHDIPHFLPRSDARPSSEIENLRPGEGDVFGGGWSHVAAYRDPDGQIHKYSARCPHLGGVLRWNPAENSWDCPLHGSRFSPCGHVIAGPAITCMREINEDHQHDNEVHP